MEELANNQDQVNIRFAIGLLKISRATYYRRSKPPISKPCGTPKTKLVPRALKPEDKETIRRVVYSARFVDFSVSEIFFTLLDEGIYLASIRTIYRVLQEDESSRERRRQKAHPVYKKPELLATGINQVWSWDITLLRGPVKGQYYRLYVLLDIFSRYVVGYTLAHKESGEIAREMIRDSAAREGIPEGTLTIHSDRGPAMISQEVSVLLGKLEIHKSHSRPHVSNDNPYSESQFKTLKYHWEFPDRFGCFEEANEFIKAFIGWYNHEHHHEGINFLTPAMVHHGKGKEVLESRSKIMEQAYKAHPERFVKGKPQVEPLPDKVWINEPFQHKEQGQNNQIPKEPEFEKSNVHLPTGENEQIPQCSKMNLSQRGSSPEHGTPFGANSFPLLTEKHFDKLDKPIPPEWDCALEQNWSQRC